MNYKNYPNTKTTPIRMARKRLRRDVFLHNRRLAKLARRPRGTARP